MVQAVCFFNALLWMSAESDTPIPSIIAIVSMVGALVAEKNSTIRLAAKNRAKSKTYEK